MRRLLQREKQNKHLKTVFVNLRPENQVKNYIYL